MRPILVAVGGPIVSGGLDHARGYEQPGIEHLLAEAAVEALDECALFGLARVDGQQLDAVLVGSFGEGFSRQLRLLVEADRFWLAVDLHQLAPHAPPRDDGIEVRHSMSSATRLPSPITLSVRNGRP